MWGVVAVGARIETVVPAPTFAGTTDDHGTTLTYTLSNCPVASTASPV